jgi:drug/metabolite transporter (DMT)-like permease
MRHILVILLCIIFGSNIVAVKISLLGLDPFTIAGLRFGIAAITIAIWALVMGHSFNIRRNNIIHILLLGIVLFAQISFMNYGISRTSGSRASILINLQPFFVLFIAHYSNLNERITIKKFVGMTLGFIGVLIIFSAKKGISENLNIGDIMVLLSSFLWAFSAIYIKQIIEKFQTFHVTFYPMLIATPLFFLQGFMCSEQYNTVVDVTIILALFYQSIIVTSFGFVAWYYMLEKYGVTALHSFTFIMPVAGVVLSNIFLGEIITNNITLALIFIIIGIIMINHKESSLQNPDQSTR